MIYNSIIELIGNTPIVRLNNIEKEFGIDCKIYAKLEKQNPLGSIKDRPVNSMLEAYIESGKSLKGATIVESTSGNTGIAIAAFANYYNYKAIIVMPESVSLQRRELIKALGAELVLVKGGIPLCNEEASRIVDSIPGAFSLGQFSNLANPKAHHKTANEIHNDLPNLDYLFAGIGTGGTVTGIKEYYLKRNLKTKVIGVEPIQSPFFTQNGKSGPHKIQGIGAGFNPSIFNKDYIDDIISVDDIKTIEMAKQITKSEGYLVGISSGASLLGAIKYIKENNLKNKEIVVIFPDTGERYKWS